MRCSPAPPLGVPSGAKQPVSLQLHSQQHTPLISHDLVPEPQLLLYHSSSQNLKEIAKLQQLSVTATQEGNISTSAIQSKRGLEGWGQDELHLLPPGCANQLIPAADQGLCTCGVPPCCRVSQPQSCHVWTHLQARSCQLAEQQAWDTVRGKEDGLQHSPWKLSPMSCRKRAGKGHWWNLNLVRWFKSTQAVFRLRPGNEHRLQVDIAQVFHNELTSYYLKC